jgi:hypothetical protein
MHSSQNTHPKDAVDFLDFGDDPSPPRRRWLRRLLLSIFSLIVLTIVGGFIRYKWVEHTAQMELDAVIAELDEADPHWRLEDIEAARKVIPDDENAALVVMQIAARLPKPWPSDAAGNSPFRSFRAPLSERLAEVDPSQRLEPEVAYELEEQLKAARPALEQTSALTHLLEGRFPITYSADYYATPIQVQDARLVASLLQAEGIALAQANDIEGAMTAARGILVAGRSIGDEPCMVSQLVRMACGYISVLSLERTLAQGQPSESSLGRLQWLLEDEESMRLLETSLRGERAGGHRLLSSIESGEVSLSAFLASPGGGSGSGPNKLEDMWVNTFGTLMAKQQHAALLRAYTKCVEAARLPLNEQVERFAQIDQTVKRERTANTLFIGLLVPGSAKVGVAFARSRASLRCAIIALAAERFRLAHQRWPKELAELSLTFIKGVPTDPYDGHPLRLAVLDDGIVIYSIGPDLQDNGGTINRKNAIAPGSDLGFRLWNVVARRRPALNPDVGPPQPTQEELEIRDFLKSQRAGDVPEEDKAPLQPAKDK